ncbi:DNA-3-methyladenine glycosylase 2 [Arthrobacter castelli]|uniref:DNA-3-methyladenine glycosylase 2 n=1 Tax=Arthrobacter castelli TaxID=271431 RepID=UPI0003F72F44|nr:AlkA N-terminal domain-containing protein [Arthrobacter castelli]
MHRTLAYRQPYASDALLAALAAHAVPGLEATDPAARTHTRTIKTGGGPVVVTVGFQVPGQVDLTIRTREAVPAPAASAIADEVEQRVRHWLDLDADPAIIDAALSNHAQLAPLVAKRPGLRVLGTVDGFETAVLTVMGQQVSLAAARTFGGRLAEAYGTSVSDGYLAFPDPETLAAVPVEELRAAVGLTGSRAKTVHAVAAAAASGTLRLVRGAHQEETRTALLAIAGIGPWTADYLAVRVNADRDAYPSGDLVLRRALGVKTAAQASALSEPWRPHRAYALFHLWTQDAYA